MKPRTVPLPEIAPQEGELWSLCFNDEWSPYVLGALKYMLRCEYWGEQPENDVEQALKWANELLSSIEYACSGSEEPRFSCSQETISSDQDWTQYASYGHYSGGDGWQTSQFVEGGQAKYSLIAGPTFLATTTIIRVEVDVDWANLGTSNYSIGIFERTGPDSFVHVGGSSNYTPEQGFRTYVWNFPAGTPAANVYVNPNGWGAAGIATVTGIRVFGTGDNNVCP